MARSSKKPAPKKTTKKAAPKAAAKKPAAGKTSAVKKKPAAAQKPKAENGKSAQPKAAATSSRPNGKLRKVAPGTETMAIIGNNHKPDERRLDPFIRAQKEKLLQLRDA